VEIKSFRGKTSMLSTEIMEKNEQLGNVRPRQGTVPCPIQVDADGKPVCAWDFKTGSATLTQSRISQMQEKSGLNISIQMIK
jgi:hypothetical protein